MVAEILAAGVIHSAVRALGQDPERLVSESTRALDELPKSRGEPAWVASSTLKALEDAEARAA